MQPPKGNVTIHTLGPLAEASLSFHEHWCRRVSGESRRGSGAWRGSGAGGLGSDRSPRGPGPCSGCCWCCCDQCAGRWMKSEEHGPAWTLCAVTLGFFVHSSPARPPSSCPESLHRRGVLDPLSQGHVTHLGSKQGWVDHNLHQTCQSPGHRYGYGSAHATSAASPSPPSPFAPGWRPWWSGRGYRSAQEIGLCLWSEGIACLSPWGASLDCRFEQLVVYAFQVPGCGTFWWAGRVNGTPWRAYHGGPCTHWHWLERCWGWAGCHKTGCHYGWRGCWGRRLPCTGRKRPSWAAVHGAGPSPADGDLALSWGSGSWWDRSPADKVRTGKCGEEERWRTQASPGLAPICSRAHAHLLPRWPNSFVHRT